jgi:hypothetical protein
MIFYFLCVALCNSIVIVNSHTTDNRNDELKKKELHVCKENGKICFSPGCIHAASDMLKKMDNSVDPCDDFYTYR